jgi:nucleoside-diphosphate-sugar epimerase
MRVLVTGGGGFIGRSVTTQLLGAGHQVTVLDRAVSDPIANRDLTNHDVRVVVGDTQNADVVFEAMTRQDCVAHLAAGSSFLMYESDPVQETTGAVAGFHTVLDSACRAGVPRVVYASTSAVYEGNPVPYRETMPLHPPDLKALAKKVNEEIAALYHKRYGIQTLALRPFSVYGVGETSKGPYANIASLFTWAMAAGHRPLVWGSGIQTRDFVFVEDVARAVVLAVASSEVGAVNVGTGVETSFLDVIALVNRALDTALEPEYVDVPISVYAKRLLADPAHAKSLLGFEAKVSIEDGVMRIVDHVSSLDSADRARLAGLQMRFRHGVTRTTDRVPGTMVRGHLSGRTSSSPPRLAPRSREPHRPA